MVTTSAGGWHCGTTDSSLFGVGLLFAFGAGIASSELALDFDFAGGWYCGATESSVLGLGFGLLFAFGTGVTSSDFAFDFDDFAGGWYCGTTESSLLGLGFGLLFVCGTGITSSDSARDRCVLLNSSFARFAFSPKSLATSFPVLADRDRARDVGLASSG